MCFSLSVLSHQSVLLLRYYSVASLTNNMLTFVLYEDVSKSFRTES